MQFFASLETRHPTNAPGDYVRRKTVIVCSTGNASERPSLPGFDSPRESDEPPHPCREEAVLLETTAHPPSRITGDVVPSPSVLQRLGWLHGSTLVLAVAAWCVLWNKLRVDWATNDQYGYGWFVPPLSMVLFLLRWPDRPVARATKHGWILAALTGLSLFLLVPVRLIEEPNADWRLLVWIHAVLLVTLTLAAIAWSGGRGWTRHFLFPVLFLLLAVRWPSGPEQAIVQSLMRWVASVATEAMNMLGIPAVRQGNIIRVHEQLVGVDEACSGIRSLQTMIMASLFLGELSRFGMMRRLVLLVCGLLFALAANVFRSGFLVWIAARQGVEDVERLHDRAGVSVLIFIFFGLVCANRWLERGHRSDARLSSDDHGRGGAGQPALPDAQGVVGEAANEARPLSAGWIFGAAAWLITIELAVGTWYGSHERGISVSPAWTVSLPKDAPGFREVRIDNTSHNLLRFDESRTGHWYRPEVSPANCTLFFFRWEPGRTSASLASLHQPHICLAATGMEEIADYGVQPCATPAGVTLPVQRFEFLQNGHQIFVFWTVWQNRPNADPVAAEPESRWDRLRPVFRGERNLGQQTLEMVVTGPRSLEEAQAVFSREISNGLVRREG